MFKNGSKNILGLDQSPRVLVIKVKDSAALASKQNPFAALAAKIGPDTIDSAVYTGMQQQIATVLNQNGVQADVSVMNLSNLVPAAPSSELGTLFKGAAIGVGTVGVGYAAWHFLLKGLFERFFGGVK